MVDLAQQFIDLRRNIQGVVYGAGAVEADHADDENSESGNVHLAGSAGSLQKKRCCGHNSQYHGDEMSDGTAGIF